MEFYIQWLFNKILTYEKYYTNGSKEKHELSIFSYLQQPKQGKMEQDLPEMSKRAPNITEVRKTKESLQGSWYEFES